MIELEEHKSYTQDKAIEKMLLPMRVYIPLSQHLGKACVAEVKVGDSVLIGQRIAFAEAKVYAPIHSSITGKVIAIQDWPHPVLGRCRAVVIEGDGKDSAQVHLPAGRQVRAQEEVDKLTAEEIREIVFKAGIVGMGGASFPTHIKLTPPKPVNTLIINGAECEPYLTGDYRLMMEKTKEILQGIDLVAKCVGAKEVFIAIEENKPKAIEAFNSCIEHLEPKIEKPLLAGRQRTPMQVVVLRSVYPQGGEKQLIKNVLGKEVPRGKLPFDAGVSVQNVGTVLAIYEALYLDKPLYERVVTVTGSCVSNPKNLLVRIGTPIKELISYCGPLKEEPAKIISGGPMMGVAQYTDEAPVIKSTTAVLLMNKKESVAKEEMSCIRCGACVKACPMSLMPTCINLVSQKQMWQEAKLYGAPDCVECGLCSYVCPSNIKLVQSIRRAKFELMK